MPARPRTVPNFHVMIPPPTGCPAATPLPGQAMVKCVLKHSPTGRGGIIMKTRPRRSRKLVVDQLGSWPARLPPDLCPLATADLWPLPTATATAQT